MIIREINDIIISDFSDFIIAYEQSVTLKLDN